MNRQDDGITSYDISSANLVGTPVPQIATRAPMARAELLRPVTSEAGRRRRAAWIAVVTGVLLVVGVAMIAVYREEGPAALANGSNSLGAVNEAQQAANSAEGQVAMFLAAMKAQTKVPKLSDAHALDWNWAPELKRDKSVQDWVGSDWVKPMAGDREIKKIAPPKFGHGSHRSMAAAKSSEGLASKVTSGKVPTLPQMPALQPLHYFTRGSGESVRSDWNTRCV